MCGPPEFSYRVLVLEVGVHVVDLGRQKVARAWNGARWGRSVGRGVWLVKGVLIERFGISGRLVLVISRMCGFRLLDRYVMCGSG